MLKIAASKISIYKFTKKYYKWKWIWPKMPKFGLLKFSFINLQRNITIESKYDPKCWKLGFKKFPFINL